jgi:hypothetical protein
MSTAAIEAVDRILAEGGDPDDILRSVVEALVASGSCAFAWILFSEEGELVPGPQSGEPDPADRTRVPVLFNADHVADLVADGCEGDTAFLDQIAVAISPHCLVGWDTGGVPWDSVS